MKITLEIAPSDILAIARVLNAKHAGDGYFEDDDDRSNDVLTRIVLHAAVLHGMKAKCVKQVFARDFRRFNCRTGAIAGRNPKRQ